jgi:putative protease
LVNLISPITSFSGATKIISAGADELYCGVKIPGIRYTLLSQRNPQMCNLPTYDELRRVVDYAHEQGVETIVTTDFPIMTEAIEKQLENHIRSCIESGVDALIATDIGTILAIKDIEADIPIYASTYLASMNYEAVDFLRKLGVKRVILERHVTIDEIKEIVQLNDLEIEVFVHGPGCSNINVNCYGCISSQFVKRMPKNPDKKIHVWPPCLLEYEVYRIEGKDLQKMKDTPILDAYSYCSLCQLPSLIKTGATGFKIVGRCLPLTHQEEITKIYREFIDLIEQDQMELFQKRLEKAKSEVSMRNVDLRLCEQKRCYYNPLFHVPYRISVNQS